MLLAPQREEVRYDGTDGNAGGGGNTNGDGVIDGGGNTVGGGDSDGNRSKVVVSSQEGAIWVLEYAHFWHLRDRCSLPLVAGDALLTSS